MHKLTSVGSSCTPESCAMSHSITLAESPYSTHLYTTGPCAFSPRSERYLSHVDSDTTWFRTLKAGKTGKSHFK